MGDPVRLENRQHVAGETAELFQEHLPRHGATVEVHLHRTGAGVLRELDQFIRHLGGCAPGQTVGQLLDVRHGHVAEITAVELGGAEILRPQVIGGALGEFINPYGEQWCSLKPSPS